MNRLQSENTDLAWLNALATPQEHACTSSSPMDFFHVLQTLNCSTSVARLTVDHSTQLSLLQDWFSISHQLSDVVLPSLPTSTLSFQLVQYSWLQSTTPRRLSSSIQQLKCLPVKFCMRFKAAKIVHDILHHHSPPPYLCHLVTLSTNNSPRRQLISNQIHRARTEPSLADIHSQFLLIRGLIQSSSKPETNWLSFCFSKRSKISF